MRPNRADRMLKVLALAGLGLLLAGCDEEPGELRDWMEQTRKETAVIRETLPEPKSFEPYRYASAGGVDPFSLQKLKVGMPSLAREGGSLRPDANRAREVLEAFPLDSLKMVGNLVREGQVVALVQGDRMLYQVRVGNYVGQNFGRVIRVSEDEVAIKEIVQDAAGDWIERDTALRLQVQESGK